MVRECVISQGFVLMRSFPGADNNEEYWNLLFNGENHIREVPDERWNKKHFYSADRTQLGKTFAIHAGILKDE